MENFSFAIFFLVNRYARCNKCTTVKARLEHMKDKTLCSKLLNV